MILRVNGRARPAHEAVASVSVSPVYEMTRRIVKVRERWDISGRLIPEHPTSDAKMTAMIADLNSTFMQPNPDLVFYTLDGQETALAIKASQCLAGPYVIDSGLPNQPDDVYSNGMGYRISFECEKLVSGSFGANVLLEFSETLEEGEGGREDTYVGGSVNMPQRQVAFQNKPWTYVQSGRAVGLLAWPFIPPPIFPAAQIKKPVVRKVSPRVLGVVDTEYEISWQYEFAWHQQLFGNPHRLF